MTYDDDEELALLRVENAELRDTLARVQKALLPHRGPVVAERALRLLRKKAASPRDEA